MLARKEHIDDNDGDDGKILLVIHISPNSRTIYFKNENWFNCLGVM